MGLNTVIAIIRNEKLEQVEECLQELGIEGISISRVKGYGKYKNFYARDMMTTHIRLELFTSAAKAKGIAQAIMEAAYSGESDDGIVSILPVQHCYRIHTRSALEFD